LPLLAPLDADDSVGLPVDCGDDDAEDPDDGGGGDCTTPLTGAGDAIAMSFPTFLEI
jgi:hypothetical protein